MWSLVVIRPLLLRRGAVTAAAAAVTTYTCTARFGRWAVACAPPCEFMERTVIEC